MSSNIKLPGNCLLLWKQQIEYINHHFNQIYMKQDKINEKCQAQTGLDANAGFIQPIDGNKSTEQSKTQNCDTASVPSKQTNLIKTTLTSENEAESDLEYQLHRTIDSGKTRA